MRLCYCFLPTNIQDEILNVLLKKWENSAIFVKRQRQNSQIQIKQYNEAIFLYLHLSWCLICRNISENKFSKSTHVCLTVKGQMISTYIYIYIHTPHFSAIPLKATLRAFFYVKIFPEFFSPRESIFWVYSVKKTPRIYFDLLHRKSSQFTWLTDFTLT